MGTPSLQEKQWEALKDISMSMVKRLEPKDLIPDMLAVLSESEVEQLSRAEITRKYRVLELIMVLGKQKQHWFHYFHVALCQNQYEDLSVKLDQALNARIFPPNFNDDKQIDAELEKELKGALREFYCNLSFPLPDIDGATDGSHDLSIGDKSYIERSLVLMDGSSVPFKSLLAANKQKKNQRKPVIIQDEAGGGKTVLVNRACYDWAMQENEDPQKDFQFVLMARLRDIKPDERYETCFDLCWDWLTKRSNGICLDDSEATKKMLQRKKKARPPCIQLILDGLDEFNVSMCTELEKLFHSGEDWLMRLPTIITSRPYRSVGIKRRYKIVRIAPLSLEDQVSYIENFTFQRLLNDYTGTELAKKEEFIGQLKKSGEMQKAMHSPLLLWIRTSICAYAEINHNPSQENLSNFTVYKELCLALLNRRGCKVKRDNWLQDSRIVLLSRFAFNKTVDDQRSLSFPKEIIEKEFKELDEDDKGETMKLAKYSGILTVEKNKSHHIEVYSFKHRTIQHFFAAIAVGLSLTASCECQQTKSREITRKTYEMFQEIYSEESTKKFLWPELQDVYLFVFGFVASKAAENNDIFEQFVAKSTFAIITFFYSGYGIFEQLQMECGIEQYKKAGKMLQKTYHKLFKKYDPQFCFSFYELREFPGKQIGLKVFRHHCRGPPRETITQDGKKDLTYPDNFKLIEIDFGSRKSSDLLRILQQKNENNMREEGYWLKGTSEQVSEFLPKLQTTVKCLQLTLFKGDFQAFEVPVMGELCWLSIDLAELAFTMAPIMLLNSILKASPNLKYFHCTMNGTYIPFEKLELISNGAPMELQKFFLKGIHLSPEHKLSEPEGLFRMQESMFKKLEILCLWNCQLSVDAALDALETLHAIGAPLKEISLQFNYQIGVRKPRGITWQKDFARLCTDGLAKFQDLQRLNLAGCGLSNDSLDPLRYEVFKMCKLEQCNIDSNNIDLRSDSFKDFQQEAKKRKIELVWIASHSKSHQ